MNVLDLFSGIGAFSLAAEHIGAKVIAHAEINSNCQQVLKRHFPTVPQLGDITKVSKDDIPDTVELLCGGSPCQDLSIAGRGEGLAGTESRLWFDYLRLVKELKPRWLVWENVPNALSTNGGRDFFTILQGLDELRYHVAWRVLDASYFGVPQRRRRIFLVGHLGDGRAAKVLFERESMSGTSKTKPGTWQSAAVAGTLAGSASGTARPAGQRNELDFLVYQRQRSNEYVEANQASTLTLRDYKEYTDLLTFSPATYKRGIENNKLSPATVASTRRAFKNSGQSDSEELIVVKLDNTKANGRGILQDGTTHTLGGTTDAVADERIIRRFTPLECERLMGFPDQWTKGHSDTARYSMLGNSIAVPVLYWIFDRIKQVDDELGA